jgi:predicted Holliday junction resolvase-like endonuclease
MFKDFTKVVLTAKAAMDVLKEKIESRACELAMQLKDFKEKGVTFSAPFEHKECKLKEKAKEELFNFISEITHKAQVNEVQLKGFVRDKLTEFTNNALLDSMELNDIRAEIASLRAEVAELKQQAQLQKR